MHDRIKEKGCFLPCYCCTAKGSVNFPLIIKHPFKVRIFNDNRISILLSHFCCYTALWNEEQKHFRVANTFHRLGEVTLFLQRAIFSSGKSGLYHLNGSKLAAVLSRDPGFGAQKVSPWIWIPLHSVLPSGTEGIPLHFMLYFGLIDLVVFNTLFCFVCLWPQFLCWEAKRCSCNKGKPLCVAS